MGALPNVTPRPSRKAPVKAQRSSKLNQYGRDPGSPSERMRASSDYERETGYSPLFHAFFADIPRLSSGNSCTVLLLTLWAKSAGRGAPKGQKRPEWTQELAVEDLAQICRCDVRTVERELVAIEKRGLGEVRRPGKGTVECRLKYREWESLPDYKTPVIEMPAAEDVPESLDEADEAKPGNQRVTGKKPVRVAGGATTKALPVNCGVKTFRYRAEGPVDLDITAVIKAGELVVTSALPASWLEKLENLKSTSSDFNDLDCPPRHGRRGEVANTGRKSAGVSHPRAGELTQLFDPFLAKYASVLLSMDSASLLKACEAVQDCDHDYLVKFAVQRAASPIRKPSHVPLICHEAYTSWKASKLLDGTRVAANKGTPAERAIKAALENARRK
jgi:hypothetical protein